MSSELRYRGNPGQTVKACIKRRGTRWNGSAMVAPSTIADASWATGMVSMTELLTSNSTATGEYVGDFPAGITTQGDYDVDYYETSSPTPGQLEDGSQPVIWDGVAEVELVTLAPLLAVLAGETRCHVVQTVTISGTPTGGTFALRYNGETTAALAYNAAAATVQSALEGLAGIGTGNAAVSGSAGGPYTVTLGGTLDLTALYEIKAPSSHNLLTGGTAPKAKISTTVRYLKRDGSTTGVTIEYAPTPGSRTDSTIA